MPTLQLGRVEGLQISGGGVAFPERTLSNLDVLRALPARAWRRERVPAEEELQFLADGAAQTLGVRHRAWAHLVGESFDAGSDDSATLSIRAGRAALSDAGVGAAEISLLLVATSTPNRMTGTVSAQVGEALGLDAACLDLRAGCSAGLFALAQAALHLQAGVEHVLVIGSETFSKVIPPESKATAMALGDGAAAVVLSRGPGAMLSAALRTEGGLRHLVSTPGVLPPSQVDLDAGRYFLTGDAEGLTRAAADRYLVAIEQALRKAGLASGQVDLFVPHQTSLPLIDEVAARVGIALERTVRAVDRHANVGAAGVLTALVEARAARAFSRGQKLLLAAVGGGVSSGAMVIEC